MDNPWDEDGPCQICGEAADDEMGEFYDASDPESPAVIAHALCGLDRGLSVA